MTSADFAPAADKTMRLRYAGACRLCGAQLCAGELGVYERATKTVRCVLCPVTGAHSPTVAVRDAPPHHCEQFLNSK